MSMSVVEGLKIQIHVCLTYLLSVWFTLLIRFGSVWIFSRLRDSSNVRPKGFCSSTLVAQKCACALALTFAHI